MRQHFSITSIFLLLSSLGLSAFPLTVTDKSAGLFVETGYEMTAKADVESGGTGESRVTRWYGALSHSMDWQEGFLMGRVRYEYSDYNFSGMAAPLEDASDLGFQATYMQHLLSQWSILHISNIALAAERHASYKDAYIYSGLLTLRHHFSENFVLGFGGYFEQELEDDNIIMPILTFDWQITERLKMRTANGVFFEYDLFNNDSDIIGFDITYNSRQYRMNHEETRALREQYGAITLSYQSNITESLFWKIYGEYLFSRKFKTYRNEQNLGVLELDNAFSAGVAAGFEF